jgi:hypothetical protein
MPPPPRRRTQTAVRDQPDGDNERNSTTPAPQTPPTREARPGEERDPELGALIVPDEGQFDEEWTTQFDWIGDPPRLHWDHKKVIEPNDRLFVAKVDEVLATDGRGRSVEAALTLPIRQATPKIEAPDDDNGQTEFIESALFDPVEAGGMRTPMSTFIGQVATALLNRRSVHEKVFTRRDDGKIVYKKLAWRPLESIELWRDPKTAEVLGFRQYQFLDAMGRPGTLQNAPGADDDEPFMAQVPISRAFVYTHGKHRDPIHGISDLDVVIWAHEQKKKVVWLWQAFLDGQATSRAVVYGKDKIEVTARAKAMAALRSGGVAGFIRQGSDENVFDTIDSNGTGSGAFEAMIRWLDNVANESVMAGHLGLTGGATEGRGSLALSQDASGLYLASRNGVAREIADAFTADLVAPLVYLNFGAGASVPRFVFESVDTSKMAQVMELFGTFSTAGSLQIPTEFLYLLTELVAQYLDLPMDRVQTMLEEAEKAVKQGREAQQEADRRMANGEPAPGTMIDPEKQVLADKVTAATGVAAKAVAVKTAASGEAKP